MNFHKTNGMDFHGDYSMECEVDAEFTVNGSRWLNPACGVIADMRQQEHMPQSGCVKVKIGQPLKIPCSIQFAKTEKGWRPYKVEIDWKKLNEQN